MKRYLSLLLLFFAILTAKAHPVDPNIAREVGAKFLHAQALLKSSDPANLTLASTYSTANGEAAFYVFNADKGFVIVSAADFAKPILGYSNEGIFTGVDVPVQMEAYLQCFVDQIQYGIDNHLTADETTVRQWELVRDNGRITEKKDNSRVGPLLTDIWNQGCFYNERCPSDPAGECGHVYTGCVATSFAQILHYWGFPERGMGSHSYKPSGYPQQTAHFGETTYQWDNMPDSLSALSTPEEINAVATLMWHCGVAVDMQYGPNGSGAQSERVATALMSYFNYSTELSIENANQYSTEEWLTLVKNNIKMGRPVHYTGVDHNLEGHAFVCDGYDNNDYLHFNWGWGGLYNNYFAYGALNVYTYTFNFLNYAIVNIHPKDIYEINISADPSNGGTVSFGDKDGSASYYDGQYCTVIATPNSGYGFSCWMEDDTVVSTTANYTFRVNDNRNLVALFIEGLLPQYSISISATPDRYGLVSFDEEKTRETLVYDFDDGTKMGWTSVDADGDGFTWVSGVNPSQYYYYYPGISFAGKGHNGSQGFMCSGSWRSPDYSLTPDNYLISPNKGQYNKISFYACALDANFSLEHFGVAVSTTNTEISSFTTIQDWITSSKDSGNKSQGVWHEYTVDLSAYDGQQIWVAIRHFNCSKQFFLSIDDIALTTGTSAKYTKGELCTVTATPKPGHSFVNWTKNGNVVSTDNSYTFEVTEDTELEANFSLHYFTIELALDPPESGEVLGGGNYGYGEEATVKVQRHDNYDFTHWTEDGEMVSDIPSYTFTVTSSRRLVAHFAYNTGISEENDTKINLYPNPANSTLRVKSDEPILQYSIYDIQGTLVSQMTDVSEKSLELDVRSLSTGTYMIRLTLGNTVLTKKFVKE
ncbi:MAG: C10 family peptidase [Bacteroidales bacterium]|nr:C10 family peptidase [Bacteroidales bacterium]